MPMMSPMRNSKTMFDVLLRPFIPAFPSALTFCVSSMSLTLPRMDMSGLQWTPDVSTYRQRWRESTGACLQAPAAEGRTDEHRLVLAGLGNVQRPPGRVVF